MRIQVENSSGIRVIVDPATKQPILVTDKNNTSLYRTAVKRAQIIEIIVEVEQPPINSLEHILDISAYRSYSSLY